MSKKQTVKQKGTNFLIQGSILALAGIICRIIGFVYRMPMTRALGADGLAYYSRAFNIYNIALIISSYGMPLAVSKLVAAKVAKEEYKNERRIFKGALSFAMTTGLITALVVFFGADFFAVKLFNMPECARPLKVLAPTIFLCAIMGTLRGYFQGNGNMIPTSVSQILEQIVNAIISVVATITFMNIYKDKSYGAAGGTLGTTSGALTGLIVLIIIYVVTNKARKARIQSDTTQIKESYRDIYKLIIATIVPIIISQTVYNLNSIVDSSVFCHLNNTADKDSLLGAYDIYILMVSIPVAIATALSNSIVPVIVREKVTGNIDEMKAKMSSAIKFNMLIAIPATVGLAALSDNILTLLFSRSVSIELSANILKIGALAISFYALSTISSAILQALDYMKAPIINSSISLVGHLVFVVIFLKCGLGIYSLALGNAIFSLGVCILNQRTIWKKVGYKQEVKKTFVIPTISALIMGACAYGVCNLIVYTLHSNALGTLVGIMVAVVAYAVSMIKLGGVDKEDILGFPMGGRLYRLLVKVHLMQ